MKFKLKERLEKRDNFIMAIEYAKRKGGITTSIDTMEKYFFDDSNDEYNYLDYLPDGKEWTSEGSCSVDISVEYFPNLKTFSGIKSMINAIKEWIKDSIKEPSMIKYHPFTKWTNWVFVLDSWKSVSYEIIDKKCNNTYYEDYKKDVDKLNKTDVIQYLEKSKHYNKLNKKFYYSINDPTCIISLDDHDLRDGYSHNKFISLLNEWVKVAYPTNKEVKFILK